MEVARTVRVGGGTTTPALHRFRARALSRTVGPALFTALQREHVRRPFGATEPRVAVQRVVEVARQLHLEVATVRGGLDVGGAELDHVWAVVDDRVVDVVLPLGVRSFVDILRAYVAGDVDDEAITTSASAYAMEWRVLGIFPREVSYLGRQVWSQR